MEIETTLPEPSTILSFTTYYAPFPLIELGKLNSLAVWGEKTSLLQYYPKLVKKKGDCIVEIEKRYFVSTNGKCGGAPIVNEDGKVIAFHTACYSEDQDLDFAGLKKLTAKHLKELSADKSETRSNSSLTSGSASYSHATIISTVPNLMNLIEASARNAQIISTKKAEAYPDTKRQTRSSGE